MLRKVGLLAVKWAAEGVAKGVSEYTATLACVKGKEDDGLPIRALLKRIKVAPRDI